MGFEFFFTVQRQLVFHHQAGERQAGFTAVALKICGSVIRIRYIDCGRLRLAEVGFVNNKAAANRVIRLAVEHIVARKRGNTHAVFMQRQVIGMKIHALIHRERHFVRAVRQHQTAVGIHVLNETGNGVDVYGVRQVAGKAHNNGDIGMVAFAGQRQGAIHIHHHFRRLIQQVLRDKVVGELFARFHWPYGMGAGRTNTDFENIKNADHDVYHRINNGGGLPPPPKTLAEE
ncbi:hypothetical protein BN129_2386 [Cronobacter sakazakii 701]|nr:hypothetical protein BN129_2386 [Cronobacter sakazakii 701]